MSIQQVSQGSAEGLTVGQGVADKVSLYGVAPIAQRASAVQATSLLSTASSATIDTQTKAAIIEIMNTLTALGIWKGSA